MTRRRNPGDGLSQSSAHTPQNDSIVYWKDPSQTEKGTVWIWCKPKMTEQAGLQISDGNPTRAPGYPLCQQHHAATALAVALDELEKIPNPCNEQVDSSQMPTGLALAIGRHQIKARRSNRANLPAALAR